MLHHSRLTFALLLLFLAPGFAAAHNRGQATSQGAEATLALKDLGGRDQSLKDYRGKIVVLNFWATWCIPCREEMPVFAALDKRFAVRGVQFIAASADDESTQKSVPRFVERMKIKFPVLLGATLADLERLGLGDALPATAIIDRDGSIVARLIGVVDKNDLEKRLEWLLGDRRSPAPAPLVDNLKNGDDHHGHKPGHDHKHGGEGDGHEGEEEHEHGGVGVEGASTVPS